MLSLVSCESCESEDEAAITYTIVKNTKSKDIEVIYDSPDPSCVGKSYTISAREGGGELILRSNIGDSLTIVGRELPGVTYDGDLVPDKDGKTFRAPQGKWSMAVENRNTIHFVFDPLVINDSIDYYDPSQSPFIGNTVVIKAHTSKGTISSAMYVGRGMSHY